MATRQESLPGSRARKARKEQVMRPIRWNLDFPVSLLVGALLLFCLVSGEFAPNPAFHGQEVLASNPA